MKRVVLPSECKRGHTPLAFFLALEEWVALNLPPDDEYFFSWQVNPTVICGRNQDIALEVNLPYCRENSIDVVRRRSGGGCVFADMANFMFSYITPAVGDVSGNFSRYTEMIARMLRSLGIDAVSGGRNDIIINGRKVAGNAFYRHSAAARDIVHGTMLFAGLDPRHLANAITPSKAKLLSKKVLSVPARVTSLVAEGLSIGAGEFETYALDFLTDPRKALVLTPAQVAEVRELEQRYYEPSWLRIEPAGQGTPSVVRERRIEGVGSFRASIVLDSARRISTLAITGDFFARDDTDALICAPLAGIPYTPQSIARAVGALPVPRLVEGLTHSALADILIDRD